MSGKYLRPVSGSWPIEGSYTEGERQNHHEGWDKALDAAIGDFEEKYPEASGTFEADLRLTIKFRKRSPGWVGEYSIGLDRIHQTGPGS